MREHEFESTSRRVSKERNSALPACHDVKTHDAVLGIQMADLPAKTLPEGTQIKFTFYWPDAGRWEGKDFMLRIAMWRREETVPAERSETNGKQG